MSEPTCESCPWYYEFNEEEMEYINRDFKGIEGSCRIRPPLANETSPGYWPTTHSWAWCGEHPERRGS